MIIGFLSKLPNNGTSWRRPLCSSCIHVLIPWTNSDLFHGWSMNRYVQHTCDWKDSEILSHCSTFSEILYKIFFVVPDRAMGMTHTWCRTEMHLWIWLENVKGGERRPSHGLRIILKMIFRKWDGRVLTEFICFLWRSIKCQEFFGWLRTSLVLEQGCALWSYLGSHKVVINNHKKKLESV